MALETHLGYCKQVTLHTSVLNIYSLNRLDVACFPSDRWAGSWEINADFIAKTKCSIVCISAVDFQVAI